MKINKVAIIVVVLLILLASLALRFFLMNKKENNNEVIQTSTTTQENASLDIDKQLSIIMDHDGEWKISNDSGNYAYAITDLDHNGRLEIISSILEGSGWYCYTNIYEVNEKADGLEKCVSQKEKEGESELDIITSNEWNTYYDKMNDTYHYVLKDDVRINAMEYLQNKRGFVLKNGETLEQTLASKERNYAENGADEEIKCTNANGESISLEEYDKIDARIFETLEKKIQNIGWVMNTQSELKNISKEELRGLLKKSYNNFIFIKMIEGTTSDNDDETELDKERLMIYEKTLKNLYENGLLPDGMDADFDIDADKTEDKFAICDIDNDGKDELLIAHTSTAVTGMTELIYDYDENKKELKAELHSFPFLQYYDNGVIIADWSHNQGKAGDEFWPYTLYQYDSLKDEYKQVGMVDAWDKSYTEEVYPDEKFPSEVDKDGNGMIYYIMSGDTFQYENSVDDDAYQIWRSTYLKNANKVNVPYQSLTIENIENSKNF